MSVLRATSAVLVSAIALAAPAGALGAVNTWSGGLPDAPVTALVVRPTSPPTLLAGTAAGVQRSTDGGATWTGLSSGLSGAVTVLAPDPTSDATTYAIAGGVLHRWDGSGPWESLDVPDVSERDVAVDPTDGTRIWAVTSSGLQRSDDAGASWTPVDGTPFEAPYTPKRIAVAASDPATLYAGSTYSSVGDEVWRSTDGGATWTAAWSGMARSGLHALAVDPADEQHVLAGHSFGLYATADGANWSQIGGVTPARAVAYGSAGVAAAAFDPGGAVVSRDGGATWTGLGLSGLGDFSGRAVAVDVGEEVTVHLGTADGVWSMTLVAPANVVAPEVSGTGVVGEELVCDPGEWQDATAVFQTWYRDAVAVSGGATYTPVADDVGHAVTCRVDAQSPGGSVSATAAAPAISPAEPPADDPPADPPPDDPPPADPPAGDPPPADTPAPAPSPAPPSADPAPVVGDPAAAPPVATPAPSPATRTPPGVRRFTSAREAREHLRRRAAGGDRWIVVGTVAIDVPAALERARGLRATRVATPAAARAVVARLRAAGGLAVAIPLDDGAVVLSGRRAGPPALRGS